MSQQAFPNSEPMVRPQGKGLGIAGFVIALVALVFWFLISGIAVVAAAFGGGTGLAIFWLLISLLGTGLSVMGMMKLGKTGGKRGLAITGMILGIVATVLTITTISAVTKIKNSKVGESGKKLIESLGDSTATQQAIDEMADSLSH